MSRFEQLCVLAAALAGAAMYLANRQWPEHPFPFWAFLILWIVVLVAIHLAGAMWRRARKS